MDNKEISLTFKNNIRDEKKLQEYEERLSRIYSFVNGLNSGQSKTFAKIDNATKATTKEVNIAEKSVEKLGKQFSIAFNAKSLSIYLKGLYNLSKQMFSLISASSAYIENINLLEVAYSNSNETIEESSKRIEDFIDKMSEVYGLDESHLTRQFGIFKQLANAMKLPTETAENLSEMMVKMTNDIASLYNLDLDRASNALQSALAGQVRPIRSATGADITEKTLQTTVDQLGLDRSISQLSFVEKRLIMVISLTEQLKNSQGDYGRTIESVSNQIRVMHEQWSRLSRAVGNIFMPILEKILPYVNAILMVLTEIFNLIAGLLGFKMPEFDYSGLAGASDAVSDLVDGMDSAGASADNLKGKLNGLRGFDKLNVINTPSGSGSSIATAGGGIDPKIMDAFNNAFGKYNDMLDKVNMKARKIRDAILDWLGFTDGTYKNLKLIGIVLGAFAGYKIFSILKKLLGKNLINSISGSTGLLGAFKKLNDFLVKPSGITGSLKKLGTSFITFLEHPIKSIGAGISSLVKKIPPVIRLFGGLALEIKGATGISKGFKDALNGVETSTGKVALNVASMVGGGALIGSIFGPVGALFGAIAGAIGLTAVTIKSYNDAQDEMLKRNVFGTLNVSVKQWSDLLNTTGYVVEDYSAKYEKLRNEIITLSDTFNVSSEQLGLYGVKFGLLSKQIVDEDLANIKNALEETTNTSMSMIDKSTDYGITMLTDYFANGTSLHESYQKTLLDNIIKNGETQKTEVQTAQDKILQIYNNAYNEHRGLNEQEYLQVKENLEKIKKISIEQTDETEANVYRLNKMYSDKNYELDEESYSNWKKARDNYNKEQLQKIDDYYNQQYAYAVNNKDALFANEEDKNKALELYLNDLYTQTENMKKKNTEKLQGMEDKLVSGLMKKRQELSTSREGQSKEEKKRTEKEIKFIDDVLVELGRMDKKTNSSKKTATQMHDDLVNKFKDPVTIKLDMDTSKFDTKIDSVKRKLSSVKGSYNTIGKADGGVFVNGQWKPVSTYASGGLPPIGQMFVARENGPELVGQISGHTAVMNNDQIVSSVSNGVYRAVRDASGGGQPMNATFVIQVGSKEVARQVITDLQGMAKSNGKPITIGG